MARSGLVYYLLSHHEHGLLPYTSDLSHACHGPVVPSVAPSSHLCSLSSHRLLPNLHQPFLPPQSLVFLNLFSQLPKKKIHITSVSPPNLSTTLSSLHSSSRIRTATIMPARFNACLPCDTFNSDGTTRRYCPMRMSGAPKTRRAADGARKGKNGRAKICDLRHEACTSPHSSTMLVVGGGWVLLCDNSRSRHEASHFWTERWSLAGETPDSIYHFHFGQPRHDDTENCNENEDQGGEQTTRQDHDP